MNIRPLVTLAFIGGILAATAAEETGVRIIKAAPRTDKNSQIAHEQLLAKAKQGKIDIYFVGDSITRRWGATDPQYRPLLENWTTNFFGWNAADFGWGADRIENILWRLENGELDGVNPKIIVILAGINNIGTDPGGPGKPMEIAGGIKAIVDVCKQKAPAATVVLTALFPRNDRMAVVPAINQVNRELAKFADGKAVRFVDINGKIADENGKFFEGMVNPDKLHPSLKTYQIWADALKPIFTEILGPPAATDLAPPPTGDPSAANSLTARVDKLFAEWDNTNSPGFGVAVSRNGTLLYEHGYGMANLELGVPISSASVFPVASISKQFTAMSILLLVERGKLSLDDEVKKLIPEWAYTEQPITIRHLLNHTSGLRDAFTLIGIAPPREDGVSVNDTIAAALARQRGLNFAPGAEFQYNNGAYNLLGTIVKRISGQSLRDFAEANIFKPLGMTQTHFHDDPTMLVPHRVTGYSRGKNGFKLARPEAGIVGNAGLYATARDLLRWEQNFADARVGSRTLLAEMQKPLVATGWSDNSFYGFGLSIEPYRGLRMIGHGGGDEGISTYVVRFPDQGLAVAVLGNLDNLNPRLLIQGVADIYLANSFPPSTTTNASRPGTKVSLSPEELASKAGLYRDPATELVGRIFVRDGKLRASVDSGEENSFELTPLDTNRFTIPETPVVVEFLPASKEHPEEIRVTGDGPKPKVSHRLAAFTPTSADLRRFAGEYRSSEIETTYTIASHDSDLVIQVPGRSSITLRPVYPDGFAGSGLDIVKFSRDTDGTLTGFTIYTSGVRGLHFGRVKK